MVTLFQFRKIKKRGPQINKVEKIFYIFLSQTTHYLDFRQIMKILTPILWPVLEDRRCHVFLQFCINLCDTRGTVAFELFHKLISKSGIGVDSSENVFNSFLVLRLAILNDLFTQWVALCIPNAFPFISSCVHICVTILWAFWWHYEGNSCGIMWACNYVGNSVGKLCWEFYLHFADNFIFILWDIVWATFFTQVTILLRFQYVVMSVASLKCCRHSMKNLARCVL